MATHAPLAVDISVHAPEVALVSDVAEVDVIIEVIWPRTAESAEQRAMTEGIQRINVYDGEKVKMNGKQ